MLAGSFPQLATFSAQEGTFPAITVIFFHHSLEKVPDLKIKAIHCVVPNCNSAALSSKMAKLKRGKLHLYSRDILPALQADQYLQAHGRTITLVDWSAFTRGPRNQPGRRWHCRQQIVRYLSVVSNGQHIHTHTFTHVWRGYRWTVVAVGGQSKRERERETERCPLWPRAPATQTNGPVSGGLRCEMRRRRNVIHALIYLLFRWNFNEGNDGTSGLFWEVSNIVCCLK